VAGLECHRSKGARRYAIPMKSQGTKKITGHKALNPISTNNLMSSCSMLNS